MEALIFMINPFLTGSLYRHVFGGVMYVPSRENNTLRFFFFSACFHETANISHLISIYVNQFIILNFMRRDVYDLFIENINIK